MGDIFRPVCYTLSKESHPNLINSAMSLQLGPDPVNITCQNCHAQGRTITETESSGSAYILAGVMCFFGCIPCCLIPFCMDSMKDTIHSCSKCNAIVGKYKA